MKVSIERKISFFEVDANYRLKTGIFFQALQNTAIQHTEQVD